MKRHYLTKRIEGGHSSPCGRVTARRHRDELGEGMASMGWSPRAHWIVSLLAENLVDVLDYEEADVLGEADEIAGMFLNRIDEGRA